MGALYGFPVSLSPKRHLCSEMAQRRAARFIFDDYSSNTSVTSLLNILNWPTLQTEGLI